MNKRNMVIVLTVIIAGLIGTAVGMNGAMNKKVETTSNQIITSSGEDIREENQLLAESGESTEKEEEQMQPQKKMPDSVKAVYATGWVMGTPSLRKSMITSIKENGFNAIVIDIKDEAGQLTYDSTVPTAVSIGASRAMVKDIKSVINELKENDIYVVGRIVTFKDPIFASNVDEVSYKMEDGSIWHDYSGKCWPNPYNEKSWEYPIALAKEAAELGFEEIQFDYVRFPSSEGRTRTIAYGFESASKSKADTICAFLEKVMAEMEEYHIPISADVFGITTKRDGDFENIGQDFARIADIVDVVCPMVYPSHYGYGEYKYARPDKNPYGIIYASLEDAMKRLDSFNGKESGEIVEEVDNEVSGELVETEEIKTEEIREKNIQKLKEYGVNIRPYLQDFTASWLGSGNYLVYGTEEVKDQIQAGFDLGIEDFCLWDPSNKYCYEALNLIKEKTQEPLEN